MRTKKPARKELDGNKWVIENFDDPGIVEITASINQSILISRCTKTTIRIHGKATAISLDNCLSTSLVIDSLVSGVDFIRGQKYEIQVLGVLPTIQLDQVDGATIYLSKESLGTNILTSSCTGINVVIPGKSEEDDYVEQPVPEQMRHTIDPKGQLVSEVVPAGGD